MTYLKRGCKFNGLKCPNCGKFHPIRTGENNISKRVGVREKIKISKLDKPRSEETKRKISETRKGRPNPKHSFILKKLYSEGKIKQWAKGKTKYTDERIKRGAEKLIGHTFSNETIEKLRLAKLKNPVRYWLNKRRDEKTREKIKKSKNTPEEKERARLQRLKQVFPQNDTEIEKILQNELIKNNIRFETHYQVMGQPDIVIFDNGSKIAIFCDGCYWHKCPACGYGNGLEKDNKILKSLEVQNWVVLRFWEHEIKNNLNSCIKQIKSLI